MNDYLIHEAVRNLGEHDIEALYKHEEPTFHFMKVMREMLEKYGNLVRKEVREDYETV